jgi:hypothetical protein
MLKYLKIPHTCPICNEIHTTLITYQLTDSSSIFFLDDFVTNPNSNKALSFIMAHGFCNEKRYDVKVGINKDKLTDIII